MFFGRLLGIKHIRHSEVPARQVTGYEVPACQVPTHTLDLPGILRVEYSIPVSMHAEWLPIRATPRYERQSVEEFNSLEVEGV